MLTQNLSEAYQGVKNVWFSEYFTYVLNEPINDQCFPSYRNQSIDLQCKSIDSFLYDGEHWSLMVNEVLMGELEFVLATF